MSFLSYYKDQFYTYKCREIYGPMPTDCIGFRGCHIRGRPVGRGRKSGDYRAVLCLRSRFARRFTGHVHQAARAVTVAVTEAASIPNICYGRRRRRTGRGRMTEPPHLKIVDSSTHAADLDQEFVPLPYYPWDRRPAHLPVDIEEAATALYLSEGLIGKAAERLKVEPLKLVRIISRSARLTRLHAGA